MTPDLRLGPPAALACAAFALVMLVYSGRTSSIDEQSVMATADSLARFGRADANLLAYTHWDLPPPSALGRFGPDGEYFSKKAPGMALAAAPLFWLGLRLPWLAPQHAALVAAPLLTALSAALIAALGQRLGYQPGVSLAGGALLALASPALVYSRTLFTEPLALAGLALALYGAQRRQALLCGLGVALAVAANTLYAALAPAFILFLAQPLAARSWRRALRCALPVGAWLAFAAGFNLARFGSPFDSGYHFAQGEGFSAPLWLGAYGLLFSPARGLVWFFPLSLLAAPGWLQLRRRAPAFAWLALTVLVWHVLIFSPWWSWAGGVSWGPRFLLPALPAVAVCLLPALAAASSPASRGRLAAVTSLAALSLAAQVPGVAVDLNRVEAELSTLSPWHPGAPPGFNHDWDALTRPALSPIMVGWRLLGAGRPEIAWLRSGAPDWPALLLWFGLAGLALRVARPAAEGRRRPTVGPALCGLLTLLVLNVTLARLPPTSLGLYGPLAELPRALGGALPGDAAISLAPDLTWAMLDMPSRPPVYGLPRAAGPEDSAARAAFEAALRRASRLWLLTYDPPPDDWYAAALAARGELIYDETLDGYRLRVFAQAP